VLVLLFKITVLVV